jgi:hypothetical protein
MRYVRNDIKTKARRPRKLKGFTYKARPTPEEREKRARIRDERKQEREHHLEQERLLSIEEATHTLMTGIGQKLSAMKQAALVELKMRERLRLPRMTIKDLLIRQECQKVYRLEQQHKPPSGADSYFVQCLRNMIISRQISCRAADRRMLQDRLMRYLETGERDDGKKPRIRIVENDADVPAQGRQGAR